MKKLIGVFFTLAIFVLPSNALFEYNFDNLSTGTISGQDGWAITSGKTADVYELSTGNNALGLPSGGNYLSRTNSFELDGNLEYIQADFKYFDTTATNETLRFYLNTSPWVGLSNGKFEVRAITSNSSGPSGTVTTVDAPENYDIGDWIRLRMSFDSENKTVTVSAMNITDGETSLTNVDGLTNFDIGLGTVGDISTYLSNFTGIYLRADATTTGTERSIDNIVVSAVPEPATMSMLALGIAGLIRKRK